MTSSLKRPDPPRHDNAEEISRWTRAYAQNRSLGVVVFTIVFLALFAAIGLPSYFAGYAYRYGNAPLLWGCVTILVSAIAATIYMSVPRWGGRLQEQVVERLYAKEGHVAFSCPNSRRKLWGAILGGCFGTCILASVLAGFLFHIPPKYMQPISALYMVPFLVGVWFLIRPAAGLPALLWPALYAIHAVLIVAGAPILFTGSWDALNMVVPVVGYGVLSGLVGHLYSRVALARLRKLVGSTSGDGGQSEEGEQ